MDVRYYMDDDIAFKATIAGLRRRGVEISPSDDFGMRGRPDPEHLAFAQSVGRTLVTGNKGDFVRLHSEWGASGQSHAGIVVTSRRLSIGNQIRALNRIRMEFTQESIANHLLFASSWLQD
jgi:hypothetical protein